MRTAAGLVLVLAALLTLAPSAGAQLGTPRQLPPPASGSFDSYGSAPDPDLAHTIALVATVLPVGAGAVTWAVQGESSVTSWLLTYFGSVEGPALGYHYAGFHRAAAEGESLRGSIALLSVLLAFDRKTDADREAVLIAGAAATTGLALYDVARLPDRMSTVHYGVRVRVAPALVGGRVVPAVAFRF
ncbi:MAG: hypothetical protein U0704_13410 [Candidatus Eisenbacteria bacterium]